MPQLYDNWLSRTDQQLRQATYLDEEVRRRVGNLLLISNEHNEDQVLNPPQDDVPHIAPVGSESYSESDNTIPPPNT